MKWKNKVIIAIILFAAILRFYQLGNNPPSIDWDEASLGYNAYSLLKTGRDEYGNSWPISIRSFNDYKPPLYVYLSVPSIAVFGLTEFAIRFPSALLGTVAIGVLFLLARELIQGKQKNHFPEIAAFLLAISPWHLQFSRVAFEANIALTFFMIGVYFLMKALNKASSGYFVASSALFIAAMYSYHSARLVVPVFLSIYLLVHRKNFFAQIKQAFPAIAIGLVLLIPLGITIMKGSAQSRFSTVSIFTNPGIFTNEQEKIDRQRVYWNEDEEQKSLFSIFHHRWIVLSTIITEGYLDHFNLDFLFLKSDGIGRHSAVGMGLLYYWELPAILIGLYLVASQDKEKLKLIVPWLLSAPLAAALTTQTPHAVRSLIMLPPLVLIIAYAVDSIQKSWLKIGLSLIIALNTLHYLNLYYIHTPVERSHDWQYGYKQAYQFAYQYENDVEEIIMTTEYDQPYIFMLFFNQIDPAGYQPDSEQGAQRIGKYSFRKINFQEDSKLSDRLLIGSPNEIPDTAQIIDTVYFLNGESAFYIVKT